MNLRAKAWKREPAGIGGPTPFAAPSSCRGWAVAAAFLGCLEACDGMGPAKAASDCDEDPTLPGCNRADTRCTQLPKAEACLDGAYFRSEVAPIFERHCTGCHVTDGPAWGSTQLSLAGEDAWKGLVNAPSLEMLAPALMRVRPGMPESSYLYLKITRANPPVGSRMPLGGIPLSAGEIGRIRVWIEGRPWD